MCPGPMPGSGTPFMPSMVAKTPCPVTPPWRSYAPMCVASKVIESMVWGTFRWCGAPTLARASWPNTIRGCDARLPKRDLALRCRWWAPVR